MDTKALQEAVSQGLSLHSQGRWAEATHFWRDLLQRFPDQPDCVFLLGMAQVNCNEFGGAAENFERLRERSPESPLADIGTGLLLEASQDIDGAARTYDALLRRFPDNPSGLAGLSRILNKQGRRNEVRALLGGAMTRNPGSAQVRRVFEIFSVVGKGDIANMLARKFGLQSFLEYNKPVGGLVFHDIECPEKTIAYIPEHRFQLNTGPAQ